MTDELLRAYLHSLRMDMHIYRDSIREVSNDIINEGFSRFPVFVAHQEDVKLGEVILDREELGTAFTIQATTMEEMMEKNVILPSNAEKFKAAYKDPEKHCCIFLVTGHGAQFVFVPFDPLPENPEK